MIDQSWTAGKQASDSSATTTTTAKIRSNLFHTKFGLIDKWHQWRERDRDRGHELKELGANRDPKRDHDADDDDVTSFALDASLYLVQFTD